MDDTSSRPSSATPFGAVTSRRRRQCLAILVEDGPTEPPVLAAELAAREHDTAPDDVDDAARARCELALFHSHLPALDVAGLVRYDRTGGAVEPTAAAAETLAALPDDDGAIDAVGTVYESDCRRAVARVMVEREANATVSLDDLAAAVAGVENQTTSAAAAGDVEAVRTRLHHVHLPKLAAVGVVAYDPSERIVRYLGHPALDDQRLSEGSGDAVADNAQPI